MSLGDRLLVWFKKTPGPWYSGVSVEKMVSERTKHGGSTVARELRNLAQEGHLEREERLSNGKRLAWYRYNPESDIDELIRKDLEWFDSL